MEIIPNEQEQLNLPIIRSRRNSLQSIDRHINDIDLNGSIYINAGIDSTWYRNTFYIIKSILFNHFSGIKQNNKTEILIDENIDSLISIENK